MYFNLISTVTAVSQCSVHPDCRNTEQCHTGSCLDACRVEQCGLNAICTSRDHSIRCTCPPGYTGDARVACYPSEYFNTVPKIYTVPFKNQICINLEIQFQNFHQNGNFEPSNSVKVQICRILRVPFLTKLRFSRVKIGLKQNLSNFESQKFIKMEILNLQILPKIENYILKWLF